MSEIRIAAIVGGHGEVESLPILFRRIAGVLDPGMIVQMKPVLRIPESRLAKAGELEKPIEFAAPRSGLATICHVTGHTVRQSTSPL